ncbi:hypothetical protein [Amedibacillus sp. YH-ame10]
MRKINILFCLGLVVLCGCSSANKGNLSSSGKGTDENSENETSNAWNLVNEGFEKLINIDKTVHVDGVTQEIAHIDIDSEYNMLKGSYEQYYDVGDLKGDTGSFETYGFMDNLSINLSDKKGDKYFEDNFGESYIKNADETFGHNEPTVDNLKKIYIKDILYQFKPSLIKIDEKNVVFTNTSYDGEVVEETKSIEDIGDNYYLNFLENFKMSDRPDFGKRGKTDYRFLNDEYFDGSIEEKDDTTIVTFKFNKNTSKYKTFYESDLYNELMTGKGAYNVIDTTVEANKDDPLASLAQQCKDDVCKDVYLKPAFNDEIKSAELVVVLDKEGYPISYDRLILLTFDKYDITLPYFAKYTFERK